jgi:hypothetical protein
MMRSGILGIGCILVCLLLVGQCCAFPTEDYTKVLILHLNFTRSGVNEESVEMQYGHPPNLGLQAGDIHGNLKTSAGKSIREFDIWDPRVQLGDGVIQDNESNLSLGGATQYSDTADFTLVMPYYADQMTLDLTDKKTGTMLKSVNFSGAISRFHATYPGDPGGNADPGSGFRFPVEGPLLYLMIGFVLFVLFVAMIWSMTKKE